MKTVQLPAAPRNSSPVPHLISIHSSVRRGEYGSHCYPGNCGGFLIKDLLEYFQPRNVFDPMTGSGTCQDVCRELDIPCFSGDIRNGFDAGDRTQYPAMAFDFIWLHPPYWRMKKYTDDARDLSNCETVTEFSHRLRAVIENCTKVLSPKGKIAILMGDYHDWRENRCVPCVHLTRDACFKGGLWPACTEIIRFQHGNSSSRHQQLHSRIA